MTSGDPPEIPDDAAHGEDASHDVDATPRGASDGAVSPRRDGASESALGQSDQPGTREDGTAGWDLDEIEELLRGAETVSHAAPGESKPAKLDEEEINRLLESARQGPVFGDPKARGGTGQDEIERMLAGVARARRGGAPSPAPIKGAVDGEVTGDESGFEDLNAMLSQVDQSLEARLPEESAKQAQKIAEGLPPLSREELQALVGPDTAEASETPKLDEPGPVARAVRSDAESRIGRENLAAAAEVGPAVPEISPDLVQSLKAGAQSARAADAGRPQAVPVEVPSPDELIAQAEKMPHVARGMDVTSAAIPPSESSELSELTGEPSAGDASMRIGAGESPPTARRPWLKTLTAAAAGLTVALCTFSVLLAVRDGLPGGAWFGAEAPADLEAVMRLVRQAIDAGQYSEAKNLLEGALRGAQGDPRLAAAERLRLEIGYRMLSEAPEAADAARFVREVDSFLTKHPGEEGAAAVLRWKADVCARSGDTEAARQTYRELLAKYADAPDADESLYAAASFESRQGRFDLAVEFLGELVERHAGSPRLPESLLLLGEAQMALGLPTEARASYKRLVLSQGHSVFGAEATARLAKMALLEGLPDEAIKLLSSRLETATTIEGNDRIYLMLGEAYRAAGQPEQAETILRELITFFPESPMIPKALVALSQTLEDRGMRREALRVASQASQRFPKDGEVLRNEANLQALAGNDRAAAELLLAAAESGADDPDGLLRAGRKYAALNELDEARAAFDRLVTNYPATPQGIEGAVELSRVMFRQGQVSAAIRRLTELSKVTRDSANQVKILSALGELYRELGLLDEATDAYKTAAGLTDDPAVLVDAAIALFDSNDAGTALTLARRIDAGSLPSESAYRYLKGFGKFLMRVNPRQGLEQLERCYQAYPAFRTAADAQLLLTAYLNLDQTAKARAIVMDLAARSRERPDDAAQLRAAAARWGDHLFAKGDYRGAAEAYALAVAGNGEASEDEAWAKYQQANALLHVEDFIASLPLFEEVAGLGTDWSEGARLKAEYARLERRLRGIDEPEAARGG